MKKSKIIIISLIIVIPIILIIAFIICAFNGNPFVCMSVKKSAIELLEENNAQDIYMVDDVYYGFKEMKYYALIKAKDSDLDFELTFDKSGELIEDSYNAFAQLADPQYILTQNYNDAVSAVFKHGFPYKTDVVVGKLVEPTASQAPSINENTSLYELAKTCGVITVYAYDNEVTAQKAGEILLEIKERMDHNDVSFYSINFSLRKSANSDNTTDETAQNLWLSSFLYSDIYEENLTQRLEEHINQK